MASLAPALPLLLPALHRRVAERWAMAALLAAAALFLFAGPAPPILLWDESRNIVNALEMRRHGLSLVTTYGGAPDLWNTKPPLLIWLMVVSSDLFGANLWALRLPAMLAALATLAVLMLFVRRVTGSTATALLAAALLAASPALLSEHGARVADYDALLIAFTTGYGALLFLALHAGPRRWALPAALAVAGAVLTKNVAGLLPGIGIALYWAASGRLPRLWRRPHYAAAAALAVALILAFYVAREAAAPGYAAASWHNDGAGRFQRSVIGAVQPPGYYLAILAAGYFSATPLVLLSPLAIHLARGRTRMLLVYAACQAGALIVVMSIAASKLSHYILPALPFLAILAAVTAMVLLRRAATLWHDGGSRLLAAALVAAVVLPLGGAVQRAAIHRYRMPPQDAFAARQAPYGTLIPRLADRRRPITIVDPGFKLEETPHYSAVLDGYRLIAATQGVRVARTPSLAALPAAAGPIASCDPATVAQLRRRGPDRAGMAGCWAID